MLCITLLISIYLICSRNTDQNLTILLSFAYHLYATCTVQIISSWLTIWYSWSFQLLFNYFLALFSSQYLKPVGIKINNCIIFLKHYLTPFNFRPNVSMDEFGFLTSGFRRSTVFEADIISIDELRVALKQMKTGSHPECKRLMRNCWSMMDGL